MQLKADFPYRDGVGRARSAAATPFWARCSKHPPHHLEATTQHSSPVSQLIKPACVTDTAFVRSTLEDLRSHAYSPMGVEACWRFVPRRRLALRDRSAVLAGTVRSLGNPFKPSPKPLANSRTHDFKALGHEALRNRRDFGPIPTTARVSLWIATAASFAGKALVHTLPFHATWIQRTACRPKSFVRYLHTEFAFCPSCSAFWKPQGTGDADD